MTNQVKLHVGYIGKTREGKRVEIVEDGRDDPNECCRGDDLIWRFRDGRSNIEDGYDIICPWAEGKPEYETGVWYGWNGGECPVHPETFVEVTKPELGRVATTADCFNWDDPLLFRIVTPYVEPEPKLEFFGISVDKFSTDDLQKLANDVAKELQRRFRMIEADGQ